MGLAGEEMYEKAFAFLDRDKQGVLSTEEVQSIVTGWVADGFQLRMAVNLP